jgi:hypothetical protein
MQRLLSLQELGALVASLHILYHVCETYDSNDDRLFSGR